MRTLPCDCRVLLGDLAAEQTGEGDTKPRYCIICHSSLEMAVRGAAHLMLARTMFLIPAECSYKTAYPSREIDGRSIFSSTGGFTISVKYKRISLAQKPKAFKLARARGLSPPICQYFYSHSWLIFIFQRTVSINVMPVTPLHVSIDPCSAAVFFMALGLSLFSAAHWKWRSHSRSCLLFA